MKCLICSSEKKTTLYHGKIRVGKFPNLSERDHSVYRCSQCQSAYLDIVNEMDNSFYEGDQYREMVDGQSQSENFYKLHDHEQLRNFSILGMGDYRNKRVMDIGCGAGSFIDFLKGVAKETIVVEPMKTFQETLKEKGHKVFSLTSDALKVEENSIDSIFMFSVVEHLQNPMEVIQDIYKLLKPGGTFIMSTPNTDDILNELLPDDYRKFYYRLVHNWYFDKKSCQNIMESVGFNEIDVIPFQRFGLSNFINWMKHKEPRGNIKLDFLDESMDALWKLNLEKSNKSDYLFVKACKK
jgi:2-polyprenyl-3-methyl-5-hydroxy-6-metoxy-1,4-benzoquinol methylase